MFLPPKMNSINNTMDETMDNLSLSHEQIAEYRETFSAFGEQFCLMVKIVVKFKYFQMPMEMGQLQRRS